MKRFLAVLISILAGVCMFTTVCLAEDDTQTNDFTTKSFTTVATLSKNNVYHVNETIAVNFPSQRHGIYRYIPYLGSITYTENGVKKEKKYRLHISHIQVAGGDSTVDTDDGNIVIRIGRKDEYVDGDHNYAIQYDVDAMDDGVASQDFIYYNLIPNGWQTSIQKAAFSLQLPAAIPAEQIKVFSGKTGSADTSKFNVQVSGSTVTGESKAVLPAFNGATLRADVPEGYFTGESTYAPLQLLMWALLIALPVLAVLLLFCFGRNGKIIPVEAVEPPKGMNSAEVGYIMDSTVDNKDILSLIIYWADKGYLSIAEDGKGFILTCLKPLPGTCGSYEKTVFNKLFNGRDTVSTEALTGFYDTMQIAKCQLQKQFSGKNSLYTKRSLFSRVLAFVFAVGAAAAGLWIQAYVDISSDMFGIGILLAALTALYGWGLTLNRKWYSMETGIKITEAVVDGVGIAAVWGFLIWGYIIQASSYLPAAVAACGSLIAFLCAILMRKRTEKCSEWLAELLGLKEFISVAEKDRLEALVSENPSYFYNVLPYAYVMGVSDQWSKKFEGIPMDPPGWYDGASIANGYFSAYLFMNMFNTRMDHLNTTLAVPPASTSGGGGFSGGGFSGGGFGGGGGGSW